MSAHRTKTIIQNIVVSLLGRSLNLLSNLIIIPLSLSTLGARDYGILSVVISISVFFAYADFGLGSALVNALSSAETLGDRERARLIVTQTWTFLWLVVGALLVAATVAYRSGAAQMLLPIVPADQLAIVWTLLVLGAGVGIPFALSQRVHFALQFGGQAQFWTLMGRIAVLGGTAIAYLCHMNLASFVFVVGVLPTVVSAISCVYLFAVLRADLHPSLSLRSLKGFGPGLREGLAFAALHVCTFAEIGLDPIIFSHFFGPVVVAENDVVVRLYTYIPAIASIALVPIWPAISAARAAGNHGWVSGLNLFTAVAVTAVALLGPLVLTTQLDAVLNIWLGRTSALDATTRIMIACFIGAQTMALYQIYTLNALGLVRVSSMVSFVMVILVLPAKLLALTWAGTIASAYGVLVVWYAIKIPVLQYVIQTHLRRP